MARRQAPPASRGLALSRTPGEGRPTAKSLNRVDLLGSLGNDIMIKEFRDGNSVGAVSVATDYGVKSASGEWTERTEWHAVVIWGGIGGGDWSIHPSSLATAKNAFSWESRFLWVLWAQAHCSRHRLSASLSIPSRSSTPAANENTSNWPNTDCVAFSR